MTQVDLLQDTAREPRRLMAGYLLGLAAALALYVGTVAPGPLWQDSGMAEVRVLRHDLFGSLGLALSHPLYYIMAIAFQVLPFAESAFKTNLVSAVFGAVTVANVLLVIRVLTGRWKGAVVGAVSLAVAHTFWQHSVLAEVYTVTTALLSAELLCFLAFHQTRKVRWLILLFLANGLGISNHMLAVLTLVCWCIWFVIQVARRRMRIVLAVPVILAWLAGASLYLGLIVVRISAGDGVASTLKSALVGEYGPNVTNLSISGELLVNSILYLSLNFPTPAILLAFVACSRQHRDTIAPGVRMILVLLTVYLVWAVRYNVPDQYTFFIPVLPYIAILIGIGANHLLAARPRWTMIAIGAAALPVLVYAPLPQVAERFHLNLGLTRQVPFRSEYSYFLHPWKTGYHGARQFADELEEALPDGAFLVADNTTVRPIHYMRLTARWRPDVGIYPPLLSAKGSDQLLELALQEKLSQGRVFVVTPARGYCPEWLLTGYQTQPFGTIHRVVAPAASRSSR